MNPHERCLDESLKANQGMKTEANEMREILRKIQSEPGNEIFSQYNKSLMENFPDKIDHIEDREIGLYDKVESWIIQ